MTINVFFVTDLVRDIYTIQFELRNIILKNTLEAMQTAYGQLLILEKRDIYKITGDVRDGFLVLNCPGNACGIHSSDHSYTGRRGREFSSHNVDNPAQSLTLLAGIASMVGQVNFYISTRK